MFMQVEKTFHPAFDDWDWIEKKYGCPVEELDEEQLIHVIWHSTSEYARAARWSDFAKCIYYTS